ncbi:MAG: cation diffusion facilitator family transporter [Synergistaceae bacterium]|jgi:cation diffusion facilitator family transporter|nr:cation diffusion facilitator family transporter [Synergistaceae bacterium]
MTDLNKGNAMNGHEFEDAGRMAVRTSVNTVIANVLLSAFKLYAGIYAHSAAMVSDAVHSVSDVFSTVIVIIGIRAAGRDADEGHQYGHERFESVAAILLAVMLAAAGCAIGYGGILKLYGASTGQIATPGVMALAAAITSILVKEAMYRYALGASKRANSGAMRADAWHHRSDALSSVGSLMGIFGARMGYPALDPAASVVICCFILKAAVEIFVDAIRKMTDEACGPDTIGKIEEIIMEQDGVLGLDALQTRRFGERIYVDVEIRADADATLALSHEIADRVHDAIEAGIPSVKHCMVHVNPAKRDNIA